MEDKKTLAKILGFVAMGLAIISIPMMFLPIYDGGLNIIKIFKTSGSMIQWVYIVNAVFALTGAVLSVFPKKITRILAIVFDFLAIAALDLGLILDNMKKGIKVIFTVLFTQYGNIINECLLVLAIAVLVAALVIVKLDEKGENSQEGAVPEFNGAVQGEFNNVSYSAENQQPVVITSDDTVILNKGSITFLTGSCEGFQIPVSSAEVLIGKDPVRCQVVIGMEHTKVSRCHCGVQFDATEGIYIVTDYSSNGTFNANGHIQIAKGSPSYLESGTVLALADGANTFRLD